MPAMILMIFIDRQIYFRKSTMFHDKTLEICVFN